MEWISLLQTLGGIAGGLGLGMFTKSGRMREKAEAEKKVAEAQRQMIDNYEERISDLHKSLDRQNDEVSYYIGKMSEQNHAIDSKTEQIRNLTQKLWEAEQGLNRANERITALTEERDNYRNWHCRKGDCPHREPPNPGLQNQKFHLN